jgi:hypothetical protein
MTRYRGAAKAGYPSGYESVKMILAGKIEEL